MKPNEEQLEAHHSPLMQRYNARIDALYHNYVRLLAIVGATGILVGIGIGFLIFHK